MVNHVEFSSLIVSLLACRWRCGPHLQWMVKVSGGDTRRSWRYLAEQVKSAPTSALTAAYCRLELVLDKPVTGSTFTLELTMMAAWRTTNGQ